jgi:hydrogenase maturation protein HypF
MRRDNSPIYKKIQLPFEVKRPVLALGSQNKNTVCFAKGGFAYLSRAHPDLNSLRDFLDFENDVGYFLKKHPEIIAADLHPDYQSTKCAQKLCAMRYALCAIQHHHAHIASCMLDNGLSNQKVIGIAFDGTGAGPDRALWGAEFLWCDYRGFLRRGHLREVPLLGGERAIMEPWRVAAAWLYLAYKDKFLDLGIGFTEKIEVKKWRVLKAMSAAGINSSPASSMGRFFDAAASLILARHRIKFEAEAAMELERTASRYKRKAAGYKFKIIKAKNEYIIDPLAMWRGIVADLKMKERKEKIAYSFHLTVAEMARDVCCLLRKEIGTKKVVLSGGVFQNSLLLNLCLDLLYKQGFKVFSHKKLSSSDAAVSAGQAVIAGCGS